MGTAVDLALSDIRSRLDNLADIEEYLAPDFEGVVKRAGLVWDVDTLSWIKAQQAVINTDTLAITLPATAATAAKQDTGNASLASIDGKLPALSGGRVPIDGSGVTQPVSATALPLPSGAATEATLASVDGKLPALSGGRVPVDGSGVTQPVSVAALPLPSGAATEVTLALTTPPNSSVKSTRIGLTSTAVTLPTTPLASRKRVLTKNTGSYTAYLGGSDVTADGSATDGIDLEPGQTFDAPLGASAILYGRCAAGESTTLKMLEFA